MELSFADNSRAFLFSLLLGAGLGVLYGVLSFIKTVWRPSRAGVILTDIVFMLVSSLAFFIFSLAFLYGQPRFYAALGAAAGFFVYRLTLGRLLCLIYKPLVKIIKNFCNKIFIFFKKIIKKLLKTTGKILYNKTGRKERFSCF